MEFSHVGKHCSNDSCKQLDFLPFQCDACKKVFCLEHRTYKEHNCPIGYSLKDKQVPTCPLCDKPISIPKGQDLNSATEKHILGGCKSEAEERKKNNQCSLKGCKKSELLPIRCGHCKLQFCMKHRQPIDHKCSFAQRSEARHGPRIGPFWTSPIKVK